MILRTANPSIPTLRGALLAGVASLALLLAAGGPASAGPIAYGPVFLGGYSGDKDASGKSQSLTFISLGWRWTFDGADAIDDFLAKGGMEFSWAVEPLVGLVTGEAEAFEASVVPYARLSSLGPIRWGLVPYFEGGIGIAYTGLRNYGLGSRVQFSDNVGLGITFGSDKGRRWSVGYRYRHLSHAGIFGSPNAGLNAHFLTLHVE